MNDYDCINNYKVLQAGFSKLHIDKVHGLQALVFCKGPPQIPVTLTAR